MMNQNKRARPPVWWLHWVDKLPKASLAWLEPAIWTPELAQVWVDRIPAKCPFERAVWWGDRLILYIPPLCPLNPFSTQLYSIRIKAQTYLSELSKEV